MIKVSLGVSICLDMLSIGTLDLNISKTDISTVEKISTVQKPSLNSLGYPKNQDFSISVEILIQISISTVQIQTSRQSRKS
jgi:hypothetical protein